MYQSTVPYLVAEVGFEPHDLRVMSPTSYQAALPRDMKLIEIRNLADATRKMVPEAGIEPVREKISRDFKSRASANSAIPACYDQQVFHIAYTLYHLMGRLSIVFQKIA